MISVSDLDAVSPELCAEWGEGSAGRGSFAAGGANGEAPVALGRSVPDLAAVCDCDVDAIVGWQVWRGLQADVLIQATVTAVAECLRYVGIFPALDVSAQLRELTAADAARRARCAGLDPLPVPSPIRGVPS